MDVRQMKGRQENMDTKLLTMKRENEALWRELAALRQKHANQTTILSKVCFFNKKHSFF
jgi:heat shock transcription factor 1